MSGLRLFGGITTSSHGKQPLLGGESANELTLPCARYAVVGRLSAKESGHLTEITRIVRVAVFEPGAYSYQTWMPRQRTMGSVGGGALLEIS